MAIFAGAHPGKRKRAQQIDEHECDLLVCGSGQLHAGAPIMLSACNPANRTAGQHFGGYQHSSADKIQGIAMV